MSSQSLAPPGPAASSRPAGARVWFDARIRPNQALSPTGMALVAAGLAATGTLVALLAARSGLGLSAVFVLAQVALALAMLVWKARSLSRNEEHVLLTDDAVIVTATTAAGSIRRALDPAWLRIERKAHPAVGCEQVILTSRGLRLPVAAPLSPTERSQFADALEAALTRRREGLWRCFETNDQG